ncbi:lasso peptide biosynthesis B2 protein [Actinorugispora endophytica]|uniref:Transglutaminase superfamily protein n=1 Tax=Actinorugispora endophytica TaxID=1605990 RepID=A0A4R6UNU3_9ACTN|nr:lasso peptide biosynthesis B2 protein [Actinorugispora endophytica]TDQ48492.1 transglutaminase superfamily protein [Actinorugispora endophytica]
MSFHVVPERDGVRLSPAANLTARCAVGLARVLSGGSPARIRSVLERLRRGAAPATYAQAKAARDAVLAVSLRCAGPEACLPRSLAVALVCRSRGVWATWCVGVPRRPPFGAHAWVEADGLPVEEGVGPDHYSRLFAVD